MIENNISMQLTEEQLEIIKQNIKIIAEAVKTIIEKIVELVHYVFEWTKEVLNTEITIVKRKKKGKRYIHSIRREKLYLYMKGRI